MNSSKKNRKIDRGTRNRYGGKLVRHNVTLKLFPRPPLLGRFGKDNAKTNKIPKARKCPESAQFVPLALVKPGFSSTYAVITKVALTLLNLPIVRYVKNFTLTPGRGLDNQRIRNTLESENTACHTRFPLK